MLRIFNVGMFGVLVAGCAATTPWGLPQTSLAETPDNPAVGVRTAAYQSVIGGYTARVPESPRSFKDTAVDLSPPASSSASPDSHRAGQPPSVEEGGSR
ncbi:hypothetical protein AB7M35_003822 [Amorphus suaedae]